MNEVISYLCLCYGTWARGKSIEEAEKNCKEITGKTSFKTRVIYKITGDSEPYVDDNGYVCRKAGSESEIVKKIKNGKEVKE